MTNAGFAGIGSFVTLGTIAVLRSPGGKVMSVTTARWTIHCDGERLGLPGASVEPPPCTTSIAQISLKLFVESASVHTSPTIIVNDRSTVSLGGTLPEQNMPLDAALKQLAQQ